MIQKQNSDVANRKRYIRHQKKIEKNIKKGWSVFFVSKELRIASSSIPNGQPENQL
jgi:hypothetical protein